MESLFRAGYFELRFDTKQSDPITAEVVTSMMPGRKLNLAEMQDLADVVNACLEQMQSEQFSRDYDREQEKK